MGDRIDLQGRLQGDVAVTGRTQLLLAAGIQRWHDGRLDARDGNLAVRQVLVAQPKVQVTATLGATLPLGSVARRLAYAPLSTGSVDPFAAADAVVGSTWLGVFGLQARVPLYAGFDDVRQGAYFAGDARLARRLGQAVPWAGVAAVRGLDTEFGNGDFHEVALAAGATLLPSETLAVNVSARVPVAMSLEQGLKPYNAALVASVAWVLGRKRADEDDHH